jgi:hypothetical protein
MRRPFIEQAVPDVSIKPAAFIFIFISKFLTLKVLTLIRKVGHYRPNGAE